MNKISKFDIKTVLVNHIRAGGKEKKSGLVTLSLFKMLIFFGLGFALILICLTYCINMLLP